MNKLLLILIILLAFVLRFWHLNSYPALNADEAAIGYNAYSLIQTGKDEHGNAWPINFQSFNDYKPGLYFYIVMPFVKVLGLNEWAVRIPNAAFGVATVFIVYLLVKELKVVDKEKEVFALIAALFLAISPWHIHFSRGGWELNTATFFITLGLLFFIKYINSLKKSPLYLVFSVLSFVASMYCYQATRVVTPLLGLGLVAIYRREVFGELKRFLVVGVVGFLILVPLVLDFTRGDVLNRAAGVGLFADSGPRSRVEEQRVEHGDFTSMFVKVLHNKAVNYGLAFLANWGKHFHGEFLFLSGDEVQRNKVPETGVMYLTDIVFLSVGAVMILKGKVGRQWGVVLIWLVIGPVASALTFQAPSALRAENMVIALVIISAYGVVQIVIWVSKYKRWRNFAYILLGILIIWGFARYEQMYWVHMAKEYPYSSQYGVKELVTYIQENQDKYRKILVTDRYDQPYILFLFYLKYPPEKFQPQSGLTPRDQYGFSTVSYFDKYHFSSIKFDEARPDNPNTLIVGTADEIPKEANIIKNIYGTNSFLYFKVVAN